MSNLLIIVGSVRPGRVGLPIAKWVRSAADADERFDVDFVDLAELGLPFMDEPQHPAKKQYTHAHTIAWSARVDAADAVILVSPEYNHSYSPALKNSLDYLFTEWNHKPVGLVSYGGVSGGSRAGAALDPVLTTLGLVKIATNLEINFVGKRIVDGTFEPDEKELSIFDRMLGQLDELNTALKPLR